MMGIRLLTFCLSSTDPSQITLSVEANRWLLARVNPSFHSSGTDTWINPISPALLPSARDSSPLDEGAADAEASVREQLDDDEEDVPEVVAEPRA